MQAADIETLMKAASVQQQSKITTKPTLVLLHKEKCQSIFFQNLAEKGKVKIKYGWNSELWKTSVGSF